MKKPLLNEENIILIGMPGAGKSTCGVLAAKILLKNFFDTDLLIQSMENKRLQQIINEKGTAEFKRAEEAAVLSLDIKGTVIATGGSVVYSPKAMAHLSYDEMKKRIKNLSTRGIVLENGETLLDMYNERRPLYEKYADHIIDCDGNTIDDTVAEIVDVCEK